jgi:uncharacterized protein YecT (DUF1311 family)
MRSRTSHLIALAATAAAALLAAAGPASGHAARTAKLSPPVIREKFTPLGCTGTQKNRTTLQQEGCAEQQILSSDKKINSLNGSIFARLQNDAARRDFIAGHRSWLAYRHSYCLSVSDVFQGGTEAGVLDAVCEAGVNADHVSELKDFLSDVREN